MTEATANLGGVLKRGAAMSAVGLVIAQAATVVQTLVIRDVVANALAKVTGLARRLVGAMGRARPQND